MSVRNRIASEAVGALTLAGLLLVGLLGLSQSFISPGLSGMLGSLHPHLTLGLLVIGMLLGAVGAPLRGRLCLASVLIAGFSIAAGLVSSWPQGQAAAPGTTLRIGSFNILNANTENGAAIAAMILASDRDIFVVMEALPLVPFLDQLASRYPFRVGCDTGRCDLVLFSKLPLADPIQTSAGPISPGRIIRAAVTKDGATITMFAAHLTKPYFDEHGWDELVWLAEFARPVAGAMVVVGDFNEALWSPPLARFVAELGLRSGGFEPATWPSAAGSWGLPIDHVFTRGGAAVRALDALADPLGSNHRGLLATIQLASNPD